MSLAFYSMGQKLAYMGYLSLRIVQQLPEAMAYVTRSRSRPAGAMSIPGGVVNGGNVDLSGSDFAFDTDHSGEWNRPIQRTVKYWQKLADKLGLTTNDEASP